MGGEGGGGKTKSQGYVEDIKCPRRPRPPPARHIDGSRCMIALPRSAQERPEYQAPASPDSVQSSVKLFPVKLLLSARPSIPECGALYMVLL